jgi:hypothetical protein
MKFNKWLYKRLKIESKVHEMEPLPTDKVLKDLRSKRISAEILKSSSGKYELFFNKDNVMSRESTPAGEIVFFHQISKNDDQWDLPRVGKFKRIASTFGKYRMGTSDGQNYVIDSTDINNKEDIPEILKFFDQKLHYGDEEMHGID